MAVDRNKFQATSLAKNKEADEAVEAVVGRSGFERADVHKLESGKNTFRIYPPHPDGGGETFAEPVVRVFLPVMVEEKDDKGNVVMEGKNPKMKEIQKPIFNSRYHGSTPKDLVEQYVALGEAHAETIKDTKLKEAFLNRLKGKFSRTASERLPGLTYKTTYVMYADSIKGGAVAKFARLEVGTAIKDGLNKAAAATEDAGDPIAVDPFTDPDTGRAVIITYNNQATKPADYYDVQLDSTSVKGPGNQLILKTYPLTDEQLEKYLKYPSLHSLYHNSFKRKDFEWQLKGLELFDKKYNIGIYDTDDFASIVEEISGYYPFDNQEPSAEEVEATIAQQQESVIEEKVDEITDDLTLMNRVELRNVNIKEKLGLKLAPTMSDEEVRNLIREKRIATEIPYIPLPGEEGYQEEQPTIAAKPLSAAERIRKLKEGK